MPSIMDTFPGVVAPTVVVATDTVSAKEEDSEGNQWKKADGKLTGLSIGLIVLGCLLFILPIIGLLLSKYVKAQASG
jgi:hypothetical protein